MPNFYCSSSIFYYKTSNITNKYYSILAADGKPGGAGSLEVLIDWPDVVEKYHADKKGTSDGGASADTDSITA